MSKKKTTPAELSAFCAQVSLILDSGLPLIDGLEALAAAAKDGPEGEMCARVHAAMMESGSLYEALKQDACWPRYLVEMAGIGERAGCLEQVMRSLAVYYEREGRIRSAVRNAITYPIVLCLMMLAIVLVMIVKVLPVFRRVLGGMGISMQENWMLRAGPAAGWTVFALLSLVMLVVLVCRALMFTPARGAMLRLVNRVFPPIGRLNRRISAARMATVFSMLVSGGFPMEEALEMIPAVLNDAEAAREVEAMRRSMENGESFSEVLNRSTLFDALHNRMIRMGAAVGREDQVMDNIARIYEEEVDEGVARLISVIEPTIVAFLCIVIGAILLSVMLPMAGIITSII